MNPLENDLYQAFDSDPQPVIEFLQWVVESNQLAQPPRILDVGCGPGRMLSEYHRLGWKARAVDPVTSYVEHARQMSRDWEGIEVDRGGFRDIEGEDEYDMVVSINGPFAYLTQYEQRKRALEKIFRVLVPGGLLFLDLPNFLWILKNYREPKAWVVTSGEREIKRIPSHRFDFHHAVWIHEDEFLISDPQAGRQSVKQTHKLAILSFPEVSYHLGNQGFVQIQTFNSYQAREDEPLNSDRMLIIARKPK